MADDTEAGPTTIEPKDEGEKELTGIDEDTKAIITDIRQLKLPAAKELEARVTKWNQTRAETVSQLQDQVKGLEARVAQAEKKRSSLESEGWNPGEFEGLETEIDKGEKIDLYEVDNTEKLSEVLAKTAPLKALDSEIRQMRAEMELLRAKTRFPDWDSHEEQIRHVITRNPNLTFTQAYREATRDSEFERGRQSVMAELEKEKQAKLQKPGSGISSPEELPPEGLSTDQLVDWFDERT